MWRWRNERERADKCGLGGLIIGGRVVPPVWWPWSLPRLRSARAQIGSGEPHARSCLLHDAACGQHHTATADSCSLYAMSSSFPTIAFWSLLEKGTIPGPGGPPGVANAQSLTSGCGDMSRLGTSSVRLDGEDFQVNYERAPVPWRPLGRHV
jgi:hypothetical protein